MSFARLPLELREQIWRYCLPHRICEIDVPEAAFVFGVEEETPAPCELYQTTNDNGLPPVIWSVCREARRIAQETGQVANFAVRRPVDARWSSTTAVGSHWEDTERDSPHMNWNVIYSASFQSHGLPLRALAWDALHLSGRASLTYQFLSSCPRPYPGEINPLYAEPPSLMSVDEQTEYRQAERRAKLADTRALRHLQDWRVIMRTVVVHQNLRTAAATGSFGLLGDAPVQILDAADTEHVEALLDVAKACEHNFNVTVRQDFQSVDVAAAEVAIKHVLLELGYGDMITKVRPAIMFRLCTHMCNRPSQPPRNTTLPPAGRGRGRGRGQPV
nr:hypothetical protein B0A51_05020 [Rachicladosporium sp. CCFEE 5018]